MYELLRGTEVTRGILPGGDFGTRKTLELMRNLAQQGARDVTVRETAIDAIRSGGVRPHDTRGELDALFRFVRDRIHFVSDVAEVETLQSPRYTLHVGAGDCDDRATLLVAMARAVGIPASLAFKVIAASPRRPERFSHVYVTARIRGQAIAMDPTYSDNRLGYEYPRPFRALEVPA